RGSDAAASRAPHPRVANGRDGFDGPAAVPDDPDADGVGEVDIGEVDRGAPRLRRGATNVGGFGGHVGTPHRRRVKPRSATIHSGRDERWGVWGAISGPPTDAE